MAETGSPVLPARIGRHSFPWLRWDGPWTRFLFVTGKGGVGKTTIACGVALRLTEQGKTVLVVSTDPASNLDDAFEVEPGTAPTAVAGIGRLMVMNIDPEAAAAAYRQRVLEPYHGTVPDAELRGIEEQLSGQCTVEVAAFDAFTQLLTDPTVTGAYDHVIFDTAPTGHTLRLLSLPSAWSEYIETNPEGASCLGPLAGLGAKRQQYETTVEALADQYLTTVVLVSRPDIRALREAARAGDELRQLGVANQQLVVNGVLDHPDPADAVARSFAERQDAALAAMPPALAQLPTAAVALVDWDLRGRVALEALTRDERPALADGAGATVTPSPDALPEADVDALVEDLAAAGRGVVMVMGKGGVGKTTVATAVARGLARLGHQVHLSTTDPAGRLPELATADQLPNLTMSRIDPVAEVGRYTADKLRSAGPLSADQRALVEEDLRSPCTEELAVFQAFSHLLGRGRKNFVVVDTAPTGHTLLLLDRTGSYHRDVMRSTSGIQGRLTTPLMRMQDPNYTRVLIVTLAESTPVHEAAKLQDDLRRAGIDPYGWVVNATLTGSGTHDPVLERRASLEQEHLRRVREQLANRIWVMPWSAAQKD